MPTDVRPLTALRFFAASLIVLGHGGSSAIGFGYKVSLIDVRQAVGFFFVLSGFILAHVYERMTVRELPDFLVARFARIWPVHIFVLALLLVAIPKIAYDTMWAGMLIADVVLIQSVVPSLKWAFSYNGVAWTLSTELFFYLAFPVILAIARRSAFFVIVLSVAWQILVLAAAVALDLTTTEAGFFSAGSILYTNPVARIPEFAIGVASYFLARRWSSLVTTSARGTLVEVAAMSLVVVWLIAMKDLAGTGLVPGQVAVWMASASGFPAFALLVAVFYMRSGMVGGILSRSLFVHLGQASFALYLIHQVVLSVMHWYASKLMQDHAVMAYAAYWGISLLLASAIFVMVETPARDLIRKAWRCRDAGV